jgi:hypothetical protein
MSFTITVHKALRVIEVVYPASPTAADVADYLYRVRVAILDQEGPWRCLVDQRALKLMPTELVEHLAELNTYASQHGMERSARVVSGALATLQSHRIAREAELAQRVRTFTDREQALAWLREPEQVQHPA